MVRDESVSKISFLKTIFKGGDVASNGTNIAVRCPNECCSSRLDGKRKYSISISTDQSHCWVCGFKTGRSLLKALRKASATPEQIREYFEKFYKGSERSGFVSDDQEVPEPDLKLPRDFKLLAQHLKSRDPNVREVLRYLKKRGLRERDLWLHKIGMSQEGRFFRRVIFPSFDSEGYLNFYTARSIDDDQFVKYLNPQVDKVDVIFNEVNIDWKKELTVVEGPFDLVKCDSNSTCLLGSGMTEDYLLFWRIVQEKTPVLLALDRDVKRKTDEYARLLSSYDSPVRILDLEGFSDVGEMRHDDFRRLSQTSHHWDPVSALRNKINTMSMRRNRNPVNV